MYKGNLNQHDTVKDITRYDQDFKFQGMQQEREILQYLSVTLQIRAAPASRSSSIS